MFMRMYCSYWSMLRLRTSVSGPMTRVKVERSKVSTLVGLVVVTWCNQPKSQPQQQHTSTNVDGHATVSQAKPVEA